MSDERDEFTTYARDSLEQSLGFHRRHDEHNTRLIEQLAFIAREMKHLNERLNQVENRMSAELNAAVTRITASAKRLIDDAVAKLQQPDPDVAAAIASLNTASDSLDTESGSLEGAGATGASA